MAHNSEVAQVRHFEEIEMKLQAIAAVAVLAIATSGHAVLAKDLTWKLDNQSSHNVNYVYMSRPDLEEWSDDVLGENEVFLAGTTGSVTVSDVGDNCEFDLQIVMDTKQVTEHLAQDLCSGLTLTITDQ